MKKTQASLYEANLSVKHIEVNNTKLAYAEAGEGKPVIFVHGGISDFRSWKPQVCEFSRSYKAISYSRRYHCPEQHAGEITDYSLDLHARDLVEFLKKLNLGKAHLIGHAFGASVALLAALQSPELVSSLVLGEPSPFAALFDEDAMSVLAKQKIGLNEVVLLAETGKKEWAIRQYLNVIVGADVLDQLPVAVRSIMLENAHTLVPMLKNYHAAEQTNCEQLKKINIPTLLLEGEFSPRIAHINNRKLNACLSNSKVIVLQGISQGLHRENPNKFNQKVMKFISEC